jgi:hypothetical protein
MEKASSMSRSERWMERRVERRGLRPRDAAYVIGAFWAVAVIVLSCRSSISWQVNSKR